MKARLSCCAFSVCALICPLGFADVDYVEVCASIEGEHYSYQCLQYEPDIEMTYYEDGQLRNNSPEEALYSQYTFMRNGDWCAFTNLWIDFMRPYEEFGLAPSSNKFLSGWLELFDGNIMHITHKILFDKYTMFVVQISSVNSVAPYKYTSIFEECDGQYYLSRELSMQEHPLGYVFDNRSFIPHLGRYNTVSCVGNVNYSGYTNGNVTVVVVPVISSNVWDAAETKTVISGPGNYTVTNIWADYDYVVKAYCDEDGDGKYGYDEPHGYHPAIPIHPTNDLYNIDITINP